MPKLTRFKSGVTKLDSMFESTLICALFKLNAFEVGIAEACCFETALPYLLILIKDSSLETVNLCLIGMLF